MLLMLVLGGCSDNIAVPKNLTKTVKADKSDKHMKKHNGIQKLWPKSAKITALGPILGTRIVQIKLWGTPWDPKSVKVGLWAPS